MNAGSFPPSERRQRRADARPSIARLRVGCSSDTPGYRCPALQSLRAWLQDIRQSGGITVTGAVGGVASISLLTTEVAEAVQDADVVAVTVPTCALPSYAEDLAETTTDEELIWLDPGHSGGAFYLGAEIRRRRGGRPLICQLSTASHGSRMAGPATVGVFALTAASLAAFPSRDVDECHGRVDALLPGQFSRANSVLDLDLQNVNAVMHPAQMVCNASWIEASGGDFLVYGEGSGPGTSKIIEAVDAERVALAGAACRLCPW